MTFTFIIQIYCCRWTLSNPSHWYGP